MPDSYSPKQIARALEVSESSVKRWCDRGLIEFQKTAGGHRRVLLGELMRFLKEQRKSIVRPQLLGLPPARESHPGSYAGSAELFTQSLIAGDLDLCRQIILDLFLSEFSISKICDEFLAAAMEVIGDRWECGEVEVFQERRSCEIVLAVLHELRRLLPLPVAGQPIAIGATVEGDYYGLGTSMAELVLRDVGWNASSLGCNLPYETLAAAIRQHRPRLFWLSCSHLLGRQEFLANYGLLHEEFGLDVAFVVGGRELDDSLRRQMQYAAYCDNMQHLEAFSRTALSFSTEHESDLPISDGSPSREF